MTSIAKVFFITAGTFGAMAFYGYTTKKDLTSLGKILFMALTRLLTKINLTPADMIAFGDGYNDLSMLHLASMGVAMANAAPEVRADADAVTLSNDADGVAVALKKYL